MSTPETSTPETKATAKLVVAVSSRTIFDMRHEHAIFEKDGLEAFIDYQIQNEDEILKRGPGFYLIEKLLKLSSDKVEIEVVLVSKNNADTSIRIFNSIDHYNLKINKAAFSGGTPTHPYAKNFNAQLFLSSSPEEVQSAIQEGMAAATILESKTKSRDDSLKIAFDADAVIFDGASELIFQNHGVEAFYKHEDENSEVCLNPGPFYPFLDAVHKLQAYFPADNNPIRTAIVTARGGAPAHKRVIKSLRHLGVRVDECFFLAGSDKGRILKSFDADIFFDDQHSNCESARQHVLTGHVPFQHD